MHCVRLPVFDAVVSKSIDEILSAHFHFVSRVVMAFEINSPVGTELLIGRARAPRSFTPFKSKIQ